MAILANPPSYWTAAAFRAAPNDYDLTPYTDPQLQDALNRASGMADAIMRKSWLYRERVIRVMGTGTNKLELNVTPLLYVKKVQIVLPGSVGPLIPVDQILLDYTSGEMLEYTPMLWQGQGYFATFPYGVPVDVTVGTGYGFTYSAPTVVLSDGQGTGLTAGAYNVAVTTRTMWGETTATVKQYTTATGRIFASIAPALGSYLYRAYISSAANNTTVTGSNVSGTSSFAVGSVGTITPGDVLLFGSGATAEYLTVATAGGGVITTTTASVYAHNTPEKVIPRPMLCAESPFTSYGITQFGITLSSLSAPSGIWQDVFPLTDTSGVPLPQGITEAVRLLTLMQFYEQNNLANRGVAKITSGAKNLMFRSTEGSSGKGNPLMMDQATDLLKPYSFQAII